MLSKQEFLIKRKSGIESYYWAFYQKDMEIDLLPTVLFGKMCDADRERSWGRATIESYASIVAMFFKTIHHYGTTIQTITTKDTQGFMQGYYTKSLFFQDGDGGIISTSRMNIVKIVIAELVETAVKFGFRENKKLSFSYKEISGTLGKLDEADRIHKCYIPQDLFEELLTHLEVESTFERKRDEIAMRVGYEIGLRTEELVRGNNFSIEKLKKAQLTYKLGNVIKLDNLIGKGSGGGKARDVIIPPKLTEQIFDFMDDNKSIYENSEHLFCHVNGRKLASNHGTNTFRSAKNNFNHPELNDKSFHKLRHSYATNLAKKCRKGQINKRVIQDRLGHNNFSTSELYIEVACILQGDNDQADEMRMVRHENRKKNKKTKKETQNG
jgi:site-specific recombinase XerD